MEEVFSTSASSPTSPDGPIPTECIGHFPSTSSSKPDTSGANQIEQEIGVLGIRGTTITTAQAGSMPNGAVCTGTNANYAQIKQKNFGQLQNQQSSFPPCQSLDFCFHIL